MALSPAQIALLTDLAKRPRFVGRMEQRSLPALRKLGLVEFFSSHHRGAEPWNTETWTRLTDAGRATLGLSQG